MPVYTSGSLSSGRCDRTPTPVCTASMHEGYTSKADVYALGMTVNNVVSLRVPFEELRLLEVSRAVLACEKPKVPPTGTEQHPRHKPVHVLCARGNRRRPHAGPAGEGKRTGLRWDRQPAGRW
mmetsp:Transcript_53371/g.134007  ORF Transcript_53371/g.134007 Transcript_53371/m.134007 type:complete len:123 (-) Transcript_53371:679-1047(-)